VELGLVGIALLETREEAVDGLDHEAPALIRYFRGRDSSNRESTNKEQNGAFMNLFGAFL